LLLLPRLMSNQRTHGTRRSSSISGFTMLEMVVVIAVIGILAGIAFPVLSRALAAMRLTGAARSISNDTAATKTKAAANFTRARLFADLTGNSYHIETWNGAAWVAASATTVLPTGVTFSFGVVGAPPPGTQQPNPINQAPACMDNASPPAAIGGTACIVFNSRGIPIDNTSQPTNLDALYITDSSNLVLGVTVVPTGLIGVWNTPPLAVPQWTIS
jgi:prepilin-type N-terminal cleavage/methylation domain-containing protein